MISDILENQEGFLSGTHQRITLYRDDLLKPLTRLRPNVYTGLLDVPTQDGQINIDFDYESISWSAPRQQVRGVIMTQLQFSGFIQFPKELKQKTLNYLVNHNWCIKLEDNNCNSRFIGMPNQGASIIFTENNQENASHGYDVRITGNWLDHIPTLV